jgi:hypothetical protein
MKFSTDMEAELVRLVENNWEFIHTSSMTVDAVNKNRNAWKNVVDGINALFPMSQVTDEQAKNKWRKMVAKSRSLVREKKRLVIY